jgi:hypothetical protein
MRTEPLSKLTLDFPHQVSISKRLLDHGRAIFEGREFSAERKDVIFLGLADKCFATSDAIRVLCEASHVEDALCLLRVLIEAVITSGYLLISDPQVADDYADYPQYSNWKQFQDLRATSPEISLGETDAELEEMKRNYDKVKDRYDKYRGEWTSDSIFKRAKKLDEAVGFNLYRSLMNVGWRKASAFVHSTAASLESRLTADQQIITIERNVTYKDGAGVLYSSNMAMLALTALVDLRFGKKKVTQWKALYEEWCGESA